MRVSGTLKERNSCLSVFSGDISVSEDMQSRGKVLLPLETLSELDVFEIKPDGQEVLENRPTPAENFQRVVNSINFDSDDICKMKSLDSGNKIPQKTWELLTEQIGSAYLETCALFDTIVVLEKTNSLRFNQVFPDQDKDIASLTLTNLAGKKMALEAAAGIFKRGAERFYKRYAEISQAERRYADGQRPPSFIEALLELRKSWRLKLVNGEVYGDVSLRCLGSRSKFGGNFMVKETELCKPGSDSSGESLKVEFSSNMESLITKDLCTGRLRVTIRHVDSKHHSEWFKFLETSVIRSANPEVYSAHQPKTQSARLCLGQNLLMCREILSTLTYESTLIGVDKSKQDLVAFSGMGKVVVALFPGVQMTISLEKFTDTQPLEPGEEEHPGLSTQLKQLLLLQHLQSWDNIASTPNPSTGPIQVPRHLRSSGASITFGNAGGGGNDESGLPLLVSSVSGLVNTTASAWLSRNKNQRGEQHQAFAPPVGQERCAYFFDWGAGGGRLGSQAKQQQFMAANDDMTPSGLALGGLEHALRTKGACQEALACILGSGEGLMSQAVKMARHRVLRQRVARCLASFVRGGGVSEGVAVVTQWHCCPAAGAAATTSVTFHCVDYSSFRTRVNVSVGVEEVRVFGLCGSAAGNTQVLVIPATADVDAELVKVLKTLELVNKVTALQGIAARFLGWTQLGATAIPSVENPSAALLLASRSGNRVVLIRSGHGKGSLEGLEAHVAHTTSDGVSQLACQSRALHAALSPGSKEAERSGGRGSGAQFDFRKVDLTRMPGRHAVARIEALLTCLSFA